VQQGLKGLGKSCTQGGGARADGAVRADGEAIREGDAEAEPLNEDDMLFGDMDRRWRYDSEGATSFSAADICKGMCAAERDERAGVVAAQIRSDESYSLTTKRQRESRNDRGQARKHHWEVEALSEEIDRASSPASAGPTSIPQDTTSNKQDPGCTDGWSMGAVEQAVVRRAQ
jgi:hypothetical protein